MATKPTEISKTRQQTHRFLYFDLEHTPDGEDFHYIDIARRMSEMNRRLYRQGMCYHVANISIHDSQGDAEVRFATLPNTWTTYAAWKLAFDNWKETRAQVLDRTQLTTGKWSDFKVYFNKNMVTNDDWPKVTNVENQDLGGGVWDYANMTFTKDGTHYDDHAIGMLGENSFGIAMTSTTSDDDTSYDGYLGAIAVLQNMRKQINEPESAAANVQALYGIHDLNTSDIVEEILDEGDDAPYNVSKYVGAKEPESGSDGFVVREAHLASSQSPMATVGGFPVPCGLLQVETKSSSEDNTIGILIELVPGDYKGVHALPMGE